MDKESLNLEIKLDDSSIRKDGGTDLNFRLTLLATDAANKKCYECL